MRKRIATALLNTTGLAGIKHPQVIDNAVEDALGEVFAHVRGDTILPCRIVDDPAAEHIRALRGRMGTDRFDGQSCQRWQKSKARKGRAPTTLETGLITQQEGDVMDDDWKKFQPVEDIEVMLSTRDLAVICNAAVLKGQSLQDFVFLAAWNAANTVLNETRRDDDICSGVKVYKKDEV